LLILIAEVSLHSFFKISSGHWLWQQSAFDIGFTAPVPDRRHYALAPGYSNSEEGVTISKSGFRGDENAEHSGLLIVAIGDSVPFGSGVRDDESYPAVLEKLIRTKENLDVEVLNAGVPSYNMRQSQDRLSIDVLPRVEETTRVIITVQAANDVFLLTQYKGNWTPDVTWAGIRFEGKWQKRTISAVTYYYRDLKKKFFFANTKEDHEAFPATDMLLELRRTLNSFDTICEKISAPIVLLPINPFYYQFENTSKNASLRNWSRWESHVNLWNTAIIDFNEELEKAAIQSDCIFFFETQPFLDQTDRDAMYLDFIHLTPEGNRLIAEQLLGFMIAKDLF